MDLVDDLTDLEGQDGKLLVVKFEGKWLVFVLEGEEFYLPDLSAVLDEHLPLNVAEVVEVSVVDMHCLWCVLGHQLEHAGLGLLGEGRDEGGEGLVGAYDVWKEDDERWGSLELLALW